MPTSHVGEAALDLAARPLLSQHDGPGLIVGDDVKIVLADVDTDDRDDRTNSVLVQHGMLLLVQPPHPAWIRWWGGNNGRTIPLAAVTLARHYCDAASRCGVRFG